MVPVFWATWTGFVGLDGTGLSFSTGLGGLKKQKNVSLKLYKSLENTVWNLQRFYYRSDFYVKSKLANVEINFGDPRTAKSAILAHLQDLIIDFWWIFALFKGWNWPNQQNTEPLKWQKMAVSQLLDSPKIDFT